jgi:hypothetical protein
MSLLKTLTLSLLVLLTTTLAGAADLTLKEVEKAPPADVAPALSALLQPKAIQLLDGDTPVYEFWLVKQLPLKEAPAPGASALKSIDETTFLGVATTAKSTRDYRDEEVEMGSFTMRFALRPEDGNHQGTSEFLYFATLVPVAADKELKTFATTEDLVKASSEGTSTKHPRVISLRPADAGGKPAEIVEPAEEHKALRVSIPSDKGGDAVFDIVFEGTGHL